jgi:hypothetical protein
MNDRHFEDEFDERLKRAEDKFNEVIDSRDVSTEFLKIRKKSRRRFDNEIGRHLDEISESTRKAERAMEEFFDIIQKDIPSSDE